MGNGSITIEEVLEETGWMARFEAHGEARGEARGKLKGKLEVAGNLIKNGFALEQVIKFSGLDTETVKDLYQEMKG